LLGYDVENYSQSFILLEFFYISVLWLTYHYLCVCCVCDDRMTRVLYGSRWYCRWF